MQSNTALPRSNSDRPVPLSFRIQPHLRQKDVNSPARSLAGLSGLGAAVQQACGVKSSPKVSTPFRAPTFMHGSSPQIGGPSSLLKKRSLGTTRPSSIVAYKSLQTDWAKFSESEPAGKASSSKAKPWRSKESEEERQTRKVEMLRNLSKEAEVEIVPVDQARRDGEEGDTSGWIFDD